MSKLKTTTYELRDVAITQAPISFCSHRGEVDNKTFICDRKVYPIFVAPMASVTDQKNFGEWISRGLTPVIPRSVQKSELNPDGITFDERMNLARKTFVSISLKEANNEFIAYATDGNKFRPFDETLYICIDIAHGTLNDLYNVCKVIKNAWGDSVQIMTGNIANPDAYAFYADAEIDWVRAGIGGGSRCVCEGTKILMADGSESNIEDINAGDFVMTKAGAKKVINTFTKKARKVVQINGEIETTTNHKFFAIKKSDYREGMTDKDILSLGKYVEARKLNDKYLLVKV